MRKADEIALYAALRARRRPGSDQLDSIFAIEEEAAWLSIPEKRAFALVAKWDRKGWWNYGVSLRAGWFEKMAPETLAPRGGEGEPTP